MRLAKLAIIIAATIATVPSLASAQSAQEVTSTVRTVERAVQNVSRPCRGDGLSAILCQVDRISTSATTADRAMRNYRRASRRDATSIDLTDRNPRATLVLGRMCSKGDDVACDAVRTMRKEDRRLAREEARTSLPRSVMTACAQGSQIACDSIRNRIEAR